MTTERGRTTAQAKDRENRLKIEKEGQMLSKTERIYETTRKINSGNQRQRERTKKEEQRKSKTERIDERTRKNDSGSQRQRESTKERRTAEIKD